MVQGLAYRESAQHRSRGWLLVHAWLLDFLDLDLPDWECSEVKLAVSVLLFLFRLLFSAVSCLCYRAHTRAS